MSRKIWGEPFKEFTGFLLQPDPPPTPLVEELIVKKGTYGMIFGEASSAKSLIAQSLIVALASGRKFAGQFTVPEGPCNVMFLDLDQGENTTMRRFAKLTNWAEWDDDDKELLGERIFLYSPILPGRLCAEDESAGVIEAQKSIEELWKELSENKIDVLVIDCLVRTLGGMDENSSSTANLYFRNVRYLQEKSLREERPLTVVILHHSRKTVVQTGNGGGKIPPQDDMRGSSGWRDSLDFQIKAWKKRDIVTLTKLKERNSEVPEWRSTFRLIDRENEFGERVAVRLQYEADADMKQQVEILWSMLSQLTEGRQDKGVNVTHLAEALKLAGTAGIAHTRAGLLPTIAAAIRGGRIQCSNQDFKARDPHKVFWTVQG